MEESHLMTVEEFNSQVSRWASEIRRAARSTLDTSTHGSGTLSRWLTQFVDVNDRGGDFAGAARKVAFAFPRHGIFRAYGAGRGWVVRGGLPVRGWRARTEKDIRLKRWSSRAESLKQRGFTVGEINRAKFISEDKGGGKERRPLDWLDVHISRGAEALAQLAGEFYGDQALRNLARELDKSKIIKH